MNDSSELIDENEIRAALRPLRPDAASFADAVREKLKSATISPASCKPEESTPAEPVLSDWSRIAASVIPLPVFGKVGVKAVGSMAKASLSKQVVAVIALPAISVLLMLGGTLWCMFRIGKVSRAAKEDAPEEKVAWEAAGRWWKRFGWIGVGSIPLVHFGLWLAGIATPLVLIFGVSGLAMVALVTVLGRHGLITRQQLVGGLTTGLIMVRGIASIEGRHGHTTHLLNQDYISAVIFIGILLIVAISAVLRLGDRKLTPAFIAVVPVLVLLAVMYRSLWQPITTEAVRHHVASFTEAPFSSASWRNWAGPARWLREQGIDADTAGARQLALNEIDGERNPTIISYAFEFNLLTKTEVRDVDDFDSYGTSLFHEWSVGKRIYGLSLDEPFIRLKLLREELTQRERDILQGRLIAELKYRLVSEHRQLEEVLKITKVMQLIDRPAEEKQFGEPIRRMLVEFQQKDHRRFQAPGGFVSNLSIRSGDIHATIAAIELMEDWGVPPEIDVMALRSWLRPSLHDRHFSTEGRRRQSSVTDRGAMRFVARQRLEKLPEVRPLEWSDYLKYEQNLVMAVLLVTLAVYAVIIAPDASQAAE